MRTEEDLMTPTSERYHVSSVLASGWKYQFVSNGIVVISLMALPWRMCTFLMTCGQELRELSVQVP